MPAKNKYTESTADREIVISRVFDAPRELVFEAWSDTRHIGNWWGPNGFTIKIEKMDFRPGGTWRFVMRGPDGQEFPSLVEYTEITKPERIAYTYGDGIDRSADFQVIVLFEKLGDRTRVVQRAIFPTAGERDRVVKDYGAIKGGNQSMDRLAEHLKSMTRDPSRLRMIFF
jgi:uncharacterized protein YndB with AHSA1/START domain